MSTIQEIELAIRALSPSDREQLAQDLHVILPEMNVDGEWARIIGDPRPRPALTALGNSIEAQWQADPESFQDSRATSGFGSGLAATRISIANSMRRAPPVHLLHNYLPG